MESGLNVASSDFSGRHCCCISRLPSPRDSLHSAVSAPRLGHPTSSTVRHGHRHLHGRPLCLNDSMFFQQTFSLGRRHLHDHSSSLGHCTLDPPATDGSCQRSCLISNASMWPLTPPLPCPYWGRHHLSPQASHSRAIDSTSRASLVTLLGLDLCI
jgi:hypothetical protein